MQQRRSWMTLLILVAFLTGMALAEPRESLKGWLRGYADQVEQRAYGGGATPEVAEAYLTVAAEIRAELASR
jgi:hypothetical protein